MTDERTTCVGLGRFGDTGENLLPPGYELTGDRVLVKLHQPSQTLYTPSVADRKGRAQTAHVILVGPGCRELCPGDLVTFVRPEGEQPELGLIRESDVLAIIERGSL